MSSITPNMGLTKWDNINDYFSHLQLAANFVAIDQHDHTTGKGVPIGAGALGANSVATANLQDGSVTSAKIADGTIATVDLANLAVTSGKIANGAVGNTQLGSGAAVANLGSASVVDAKLASPNNSVYKTVFLSSGGIVGGQGANTWLISGPTTIASGQGITSQAFPIYQWVAADHAVAGGLTTKLRLRATVACNATAPGTQTFVVGLYPVTVAGGVNDFTPTLGTVVAGSTATFTNPSASTVNLPTAGAADFTVPADGVYVVGFTTSALQAANSVTKVNAELQVRNV